MMHFNVLFLNTFTSINFGNLFRPAPLCWGFYEAVLEAGSCRM